jgi:hypothetical protein
VKQAPAASCSYPGKTQAVTPDGASGSVTVSLWVTKTSAVARSLAGLVPKVQWRKTDNWSGPSPIMTKASTTGMSSGSANVTSFNSQPD